jgi:hypothetical protein
MRRQLVPALRFEPSSSKNTVTVNLLGSAPSADTGTGCKGVEWVHLARDKGLVDTVTHFRRYVELRSVEAEAYAPLHTEGQSPVTYGSKRCLKWAVLTDTQQRDLYLATWDSHCGDRET